MSAELDARLSRIGERIAQLDRLDPERQVFGAATHHYRLAPPLTEDDLELIERRLRVTLPEPYRRFVTRVGRAGAGPYYGLEAAAEMRPRMPRDGEPEPRLEEPFPFDAVAAHDAEVPEGRCRYDGLMHLANQGCGYVSLLIVTGARAGEVWTDLSEAQGPLQPEAPGFIEWYEAWLDRALLDWLHREVPRLHDGASDEARVAALGAIALLERTLAAAPDPDAALAPADYHRTLGYVRLLGGDPTGADDVFERAAAIGADEPEARLHLDRARACRLVGDLEGAVRQAHAGLGSPDIWASTIDELRVVLERALMALGRRAESLAVLDQRAADATFDPEPHHRLAREHLIDGNLAAACAALDRGARTLTSPTLDRPALVHVVFGPIIAWVEPTDPVTAATLRSLAATIM